MAYDSPKAIHFTVKLSKGNERLGYETGVEFRWLAAQAVEKEFPCLLHLTPENVERVREICRELSTDLIIFEFIRPTDDD